MGIVSVVLGLLILAFVSMIVLAQIRTEARTRQRQGQEPDRQGRQQELSHDKAETREWWI